MRYKTSLTQKEMNSNESKDMQDFSQNACPSPSMINLCFHIANIPQHASQSQLGTKHMSQPKSLVQIISLLSEK